MAQSVLPDPGGRRCSAFNLRHGRPAPKLRQAMSFALNRQASSHRARISAALARTRARRWWFAGDARAARHRRRLFLNWLLRLELFAAIFRLVHAPRAAVAGHPLLYHRYTSLRPGCLTPDAAAAKGRLTRGTLDAEARSGSLPFDISGIRTP